MIKIAIAGKKFSGKDTIGHYLVSKYGYKRYAFADALKVKCKMIFGLTNDDVNGSTKETINPRLGITPRKIMQITGEYFRKNHPNIWINIIDKKINEETHDKIVITDVRYDDEAKYLKSKGFIIVYVNRDTYHHDKHVSEKGITDYDIVIDNNGSINELYSKVESILRM